MKDFVRPIVSGGRGGEDDELQIGLDEVAKIHAEMLKVMDEVGFKGDFPAFLTFLRTDKQFYATTPIQLMKEAAYIAKQFDAKASTYFGHLPRARFAIRPVPESSRLRV